MHASPHGTSPNWPLGKVCHHSTTCRAIGNPRRFQPAVTAIKLFRSCAFTDSRRDQSLQKIKCNRKRSNLRVHHGATGQQTDKWMWNTSRLTITTSTETHYYHQQTDYYLQHSAFSSSKSESSRQVQHSSVSSNMAWCASGNTSVSSNRCRPSRNVAKSTLVLGRKTLTA